MPFPNIIVVNQTASPVPLPDLGVVVPASGQIAVTPNNKRFEVMEDEGLLSEVDAGNLALEVDGTLLSPQQTASFIAPSVESTPSLGNYASLVDPSISDDSDSGYSVGSRWVNTVSSVEFVCTDASPGAAVWVSSRGFLPSSSIDRSVAIFDGVGGDSLQDSLMTLDVSGNADLPGEYRIGGERANSGVTAYNSVAGAAFTSGSEVVPLDTLSLTTSFYTLNANALTVTATGRYFMTAEVSLESTSGARTQANMWVVRNTVEIPGCRGEMYCRQLDHGANASVTQVLDLTSGDILRMRAGVVAGAGTLQAVANGSRLTLVRLS